MIALFILQYHRFYHVDNLLIAEYLSINYIARENLNPKSLDGENY